VIASLHIVFVWALVAPPADDNPALAEATEAFEAERWSEAADAFARAWEHDPNPKYLYGRAQALRFAGQCEEAIDVYARFIAVSASDDADAYARDAIALCEEALAEEMPTEPVPPPIVAATQPDTPPAEPAPREPWTRDAVGHGLFWPGVALVAVGAALVPVAEQRANAADTEGSERGYLEALDRASTMRIAGITTLAVGGALLIAGTIRFAVVAARGRRPRASAAGLVVHF
jgi:tetratricopeptide (TPR) repeat protein